MTTVKEYNDLGEELERLLRLRTSPIAVKMLEKEEDIPEGAIRPKRDRGYHLAQCQAFALSRRQKLTIAMLKEDHWCWAPLMAYGMVENPHDPFVDAHTSFPCLEYGKYIGIVSAPLITANFEPDLVLVYSDTAQLRRMLLVIKYVDKTLITCQFDPLDSCCYNVVNVLQTGTYHIALPDPGECERGGAADNEIILSIPRDKLEVVAGGLRDSGEMHFGFNYPNIEQGPDFAQPEFYTRLFKHWGLDVKE